MLPESAKRWDALTHAERREELVKILKRLEELKRKKPERRHDYSYLQSAAILASSVLGGPVDVTVQAAGR